MGQRVSPLLLVFFLLFTLSFFHSTPHAIIDQRRRILGVLAGHADDPNWQRDIAEPAAALLEQTRLEGDTLDAWTDKQYDTWRGEFMSVTAGVSYGGGQQVLLCVMYISLTLLTLTTLVGPREPQTGENLSGPSGGPPPAKQANKVNGWLRKL